MLKTPSPLPTRPLGSSGLHVPVICLGTMTWGSQNTQSEAHAQMHSAIEAGATFWDTAELYPTNPVRAETHGHTESIIGAFFAQHGGRDKILLASKMVGPGRPHIRKGSGFSPATIREALEASLTRLQTDYIDLYQLHWPNRGSYHFSQQWGYAGPGTPILKQTTSRVEEDLLNTLQTLSDLVKEGKIRHIGLSNETAWGTLKFLELAKQHQLPAMVSIQNEYSLLCRLFEPELAEISLRENISLLPWSPLAGGLLSGKYFGGARPEGSRITLPGYSGQSRLTLPMQSACDAYTTLAQSHGLNPAQMAIAFTLTRPFVASTIIGATTMEQLKSNIAAAHLTLSPEVMDGIEAIQRAYPMPY
jgi:aryl-alcohol dehydrogenase-like predicted oxidoreductase